MGRAPQHLLLRPSSFSGVEESFRFVVVQIFIDVQMNGWSCSPKHGPAHFTLLKKFFVWLVRKFSKTFKSFAEPCSPKHGSVPSICNDDLQPGKNIQVYGWAALPNIPCHCLAYFAALKKRIVLMLCRLSTTFKWTDVRAPQTQSRSFHGVEEPFRLDGKKFFKNIRTYGWAVLPRTRPSSFHEVESFFRLAVLQPCKTIQVDGWAALLNIPCHGPAQFAALKNHFVLMLWRLSTTFK